MGTLTDRQLYLLRSCVEAELSSNRRTDTPLSVAETDDSGDPDAALAQLRAELVALLDTLKRPVSS